MKLRPMGNRVVVKRLEAETKTSGGIILPDAAQEKPKQGEIIAVGNGAMLDSGERAKMQVKPGDIVLFSSYAGDEVTVEGEEYLVMAETDIVALVK